MIQTQPPPKFADLGGEASYLSSSSIVSLDGLEAWKSQCDSSHDVKSQQRKSLESAQQRQERLELARCIHRLEHVRSGEHQLSSTPTHQREAELYHIENQIAVAATSADASKQLTVLLQKVESLQTDEPRVMGTCLRLTKLISQLLLPLRQVERLAPCVWNKIAEKEEQKTAAIDKIDSARAARRALDEIAQIMQSVVTSQRDSDGPILPSSLHTPLVRIEEILCDANLTRCLRLHINARIIRRLFTAALASSGVPFSSSKPKLSPLVLRPPPSPVINPASILIAKHVDSPFATTCTDKMLPNPSLSPFNVPTLKWVNIVRPLEDSDSVDFGDIAFDGDFISSSATSDSSSSSSSSFQSSPRTPLDAAFPQSHFRSNTSHMSKNDSMAIRMAPGFESVPRLRLKHHSPWLPAIESDDEEEEEEEEDDDDEEARARAREEALEKLCQASNWVKSIRDAKPVVLTKLKKRISVIPLLLTVGEEHEEE